MSYKKSFKHLFKKRYLIEIVSIVVLLILASAFKVSVDQLKDETENNNGLATLAINFETENRLFEGEVYDGMTVLDALNIAMGVGKIKLNYVLDDENQTWFMEIDGHINGLVNKHFTFYINEKLADSRDMNRTKLKPGDSVVIKYE
ncbi:MAG: hypothetical protein WD989_02595 [Candidatus Paceibacterota bacterium]